MIYQFVTDDDLNIGLQQYFRDQIKLNSPNGIVLAEGAAVTIMKAKLTNRYDVTKLFPVITEWNAAAFMKDSYCSRNDKIYQAVQNTTNNDPTTDTTGVNWKPTDPRDKWLIVLCAKITIFLFVRANDPRKMNDDLTNDYASSMDWLDDAKNQIENPDWPLLVDGASVIQWGGNPPQQNYRW